MYFKRCDICKSKLYVDDSNYCKKCNNCCCTCEEEDTARLREFFDLIKHGELKHVLWLKKQFEDFWDISIPDQTEPGRKDFE